jgi:hypothetical protein
MMRGRHIIDLSGKKFGRLLVVEKTDKRSRDGHVVWKCLCDCGKEKKLKSNDLQGGKIISCGCYGCERRRVANTKHGCRPGSGMTAEYTTWRGMKNRCLNPRKDNYKYYGGRGIKVCDEWLHSFENFLNYLKANNMYPKPAGISIDRIDNNGNYEPGNIRWATPTEQNYNRRAFKNDQPLQGEAT